MDTRTVFHILYIVIGLGLIMITLSDRIKLDKLSREHVDDDVEIFDPGCNLSCLHDYLNHSRRITEELRSLLTTLDFQIAKEMVQWKRIDCLKVIKDPIIGLVNSTRHG